MGMGNSILDAQIVIESKENASWQGVLRFKGQEQPFKSEMELLLLINKLVDGTAAHMSWNAGDNDAVEKDEKNGGQDHE